MADWSLCACAWCVSMCGVCERPLDHSRFGVYTSQSSRSRGEAGACNACGHVCRERWLLVGVRRNMQVREVSERRSARCVRAPSCRWYAVALSRVSWPVKSGRVRMTLFTKKLRAQITELNTVWRSDPHGHKQVSLLMWAVAALRWRVWRASPESRLVRVSGCVSALESRGPSSCVRRWRAAGRWVRALAPPVRVPRDGEHSAYSTFRSSARVGSSHWSTIFSEPYLPRANVSGPRVTHQGK